jgi:hypothetical protein
MLKHSLLVVALLAGTASAQPGATPPSEPVPPPAPAPAEAQAPVENNLDLDALVARAEAAAPSIETVARGTFRRARRSISIGPTVGLWSAAFIEPGDIDAALTFGIGLEAFKVPVLPSMDTVKALVQERVKAQLKDRIKAAFSGRAVEPVELDRIAVEVYTEVRDELLGLKNVRAKTMERPRYTIGFEANRVFGAERWLGRTRVGIGIWKASLVLSAAFGRVCRGGTCDDKIKGYVGPEIVLHFLTSKKPRASVVDTFVRFDIQATGRVDGATYDQAVLGVRYLLDVF